MACGVELPAMRVDLTVESTEETFLWDPRWQFSTGVASVDFLADVRNVVLGSGAGISIKPAIQFAEVRADRPGTGGAVAGTAVIATGAYHFEETLSGAGQFFFRRGIAYRLTAGAFARADVTLHAAFRSCGKILPAQEILFNPTNDSVSVSVFPLTGQLSGVAVDKAKLALIGMDNANTTLRWRVVGRGFNDPMARGAWVDLYSIQSPGTGDFSQNTGEIDLTALSLASFQWFELALAVWKPNGLDPAGRCVFHVIPAIKYA